jgi:hypothetical protein
MQLAGVGLLASAWLILAASGSGAVPEVDVYRIEPDRPGQATPATLVPTGMFQLEAGLEISRASGSQDDPDIDSYQFPNTTLRLGLSRCVELRLGSDSFVYQDRGGAANRAVGSDLVAGAKLRFVGQQGFWPAVGALLELSFPTGSREVTSDGFDPKLQTLFQWDFAERWGVVANLDFAAPTQGVEDDRRIFQLDPALALDLDIGSRLNGYMEYSSEVKTGGVADVHLINGGFTFLANDDLALDLWAGGGLNDAAPEWRAGVGVSWRFRVWER